MKHSVVVLLFSFSVYFFVAPNIFAQSSYVLPYPSTMPGGISYKLHLFWEDIQKYWSFGSLAQFHYNLSQSDKYLVEAKTLFEYKQYLLAVSALKKSNDYFQKSIPYLHKAQKEGKDVSFQQSLVEKASDKHKEVLGSIDKEVPAVVMWEPEKQQSTKLFLHDLIQDAIQTRNKYR